MKNHPLTTEYLALLLIICLPWVAVPAAAAEITSTLSGSIVRSGEDAPLAGARLHAGDPKTGRVFSSAPAQDDGSFVLADLPASTYSLAVESGGALYVVESPLPLAPGVTRTLNVAVSPQSMNAAKKDKGSGHNWGFVENPLFATLTVVGFATLIGFAIDDDNGSQVSPSRSMP